MGVVVVDGSVWGGVWGWVKGWGMGVDIWDVARGCCGVGSELEGWGWGDGRVVLG